VTLHKFATKKISVIKILQYFLYDRIMENHEAVSALGALAQEDRLAAFRLLMGQGADGLSSGEIAGKLAIQRSRMSFHLATLERAGLLTARRNGRCINYAVDHARMRNLLTFLMKDCCGSNPAVCGLSQDGFIMPAGN
jgi:ArsR family transcriptional regulator, arsenate/arsenite/antimonite-responsive transcriptional repressor